MMKKTFFVFTLFLGSIFITPSLARALEQPDIKVSNLKVETTDTVAIIFYDAENVPQASVPIVSYRKVGEDTSVEALQVSWTYIYEGKTSIPLVNLVPNIKYQYTLTIKNGDGEKIYSSGTKSFTTQKTDFMKITQVFPLRVKAGTQVTIEGKGFGTRAGEVRFGYCDFPCSGTIVSWSDTKIVAKIGSNATNGAVQIFAHSYPYQVKGQGYGKQIMDGEIFVNSSVNTYFILGARSYCGSGVKARTYHEIENFNNIYFEEYGRGAGCNELNFHVQRRTPHERLRKWLREQDEGKWWANLKKNYMGKVIYDFSTPLFLVTQNGLRQILDFQTALAWGLIIDDSKLVKDLTDASKGYEERYTHNGVRTYGSRAPLLYAEGSYFRDIESFLAGDGIDTGNSRFDDYIEANQKLITKNNPSQSDAEDYKDICTDYLSCGRKY